jgi:hypothetical protein
MTRVGVRTVNDGRKDYSANLVSLNQAQSLHQQSRRFSVEHRFSLLRKIFAAPRGFYECDSALRYAPPSGRAPRARGRLVRSSTTDAAVPGRMALMQADDRRRLR